MLDLGVQQGLVDKSGAWYAYQGDKIGQGKQNACDYLAEHPDVAQAIEKEIRARLLNVVTPASEEAAVAEGDEAQDGKDD